MAFTDYLDLRTAVLEQVGDTSLADVFDRLTKLAEARFNRKFRTSEQVTSTTLTIASGTATLPSDFIEAIGLYDANGFEYISQPSQNARITTNHRHFYTIEGNSLNTVGPDGDKELQYFAKIPTLTISLTTSNWLLENYPGVYLYGVAFEAAKHKRDVEMSAQMGALMDAEIADAIADDNNKRYSRARVRVQGVTP